MEGKLKRELSTDFRDSEDRKLVKVDENQVNDSFEKTLILSDSSDDEAYGSKTLNAKLPHHTSTQLSENDQVDRESLTNWLNQVVKEIVNNSIEKADACDENDSLSSIVSSQTLGSSIWDEFNDSIFNVSKVTIQSCPESESD